MSNKSKKIGLSIVFMFSLLLSLFITMDRVKAGTVNFTTPGTTTYTAPVAGMYTFSLAGSSGEANMYTYGAGGFVNGDYLLKAGDVITVQVGAVGNNGAGTGQYRGGGASRIYLNGSTTLAMMAQAAGGGGGPQGGNGGTGTGAGGADVGSGAGSGGSSGSGGGASYDFTYESGYWSDTPNCSYGQDPNNYYCEYFTSTGYVTKPGNPGTGGSNKNGSKALQHYVSTSSANVGPGYVTIYTPTTPPSISFSYPSTGWKNTDQVLTVNATAGTSPVDAIQGPDGVWRTGSTLNYTINSNGSYTFNVRSVDGETNTASYTVSNIDKTTPYASISSVQNANGTVTLNLTGIGDTQSGVYNVYRPDGSEVLNPTGTVSYTVSTNGIYTFNVQDVAGNIRPFSINVTTADTIAPSGNLVQSPANGTWTNGSVTLTLSGVSDTGGSGFKEIVKPDGTVVTTTSTTHVVTTNGTYTFKLRDNSGNEALKTIVVSNIDKTAPVFSFTQSPASGSWTAVVAKARFYNFSDGGGSGYSKVVTPDGTEYTGNDLDFPISANGTYTYVVWDKAGNSVNKTVVVDNIDKSSPTGTHTMIPNADRTAVTLSITGINDVGSGVHSGTLPDGTLVNNPTDLSYVVTSNGGYDIKVRDKVGNVKNFNFYVDDIDKTPPTGLVRPSPNTTAWTKDDVQLQWYFDTDSGSPRKHTKLPDGTISTASSGLYTVSGNGTYSFELVDMAGNVRILTYTVANIDKTVPTGNNVTQSPAPPSWTSGDVTLSITGAADAGGSGYKDITKPGGTKVTTTSATHVVTSNGTYNFLLTDNAGNVTIKAITVTNIDKTAPTGNLTQSGSGASVLLTLSGAADTGGSGFMNIERPDGTLVTTTSTTYTVTENGTYTFKIRDWAGNITTRTITVTAVDNEAPNGNLSVSTSSWTRGNVTMYVSGVSDVGSSGFKQITLPDGSKVVTTNTSYVATANGLYEFILEDNAGNKRTLSYTVTNIDKDVPLSNLTQLPDAGTWTNSSVTLTLGGLTDGSGSGISAITLPNGTPVSGASSVSSVTFVVNTNGTYTFYISDNAGNTTSRSITVSNIDKVVPTGTITPPPTTWTNDNVVLNLTGVADTGGSGLKEIELPVSGTKVTGTSASYNAPSNGTYTFKIYDNAGNVTSKSYTVSNIDTTLPTASVSSSTTAWTRNDVVLTLSGAADTGGSGLNTIKRPDGTISTGTSATYTVSANGTYVFEVSDNAGNVATRSITVNNIDKTVPVGTLSQSPSNGVWTNDDVVLTLNGISDVGGSGFKDITKPDGTKVTTTSTTFTVNSNGTYSFIITDNAGNAVTKTAVVSNIDKVIPTGDLISLNTSWTSNNVILRLQTLGDVGSGVSMVKLPNGVSQANTGQTVDYTVVSNGTYVFEIYDVAGNVTSKSIVVGNIDKNAPNIPSLVLSSEAWSKPGVTITLTSNGDVTGGSGVNRLEYRLNGGTWTTYSGVTTIPTSFVGDVKVEARAVDNVGLVSGLVTKTAKIDNTLPVIRSVQIFEVGGRQELRVDAVDTESGLNSNPYQFYRKEFGKDSDFVKVPASWVSSNTVVLPKTPSNTKFVYKVEVRDVVSNVATSDDLTYVSPVELEFGGVREGDNPNTVTFDLVKGLTVEGDTTIEILRGNEVVGRIASGDVYRDRGLDYDRTYAYTLIAYTMVDGKKISSLPLNVSYKIGAPSIEVYAVTESFTTPFSSKFTVRGTSRIKAGGTLLISLWDGSTRLYDGAQTLAAYNTEDWYVESTYIGTVPKTVDVLFELEGQEDVHNKRIPIVVNQKKVSVDDVEYSDKYGIYK